MERTYEVEIREDRLVKVDRESLEVIATHQPLGTKVVQCLPVDGHFVVREDYFQFPLGRSNVYCLDGRFEILWKAEIPGSSDAYSGPVSVTDAGLVCGSWEGYSCTIDPTTGRIRSKMFTK